MLPDGSGLDLLRSLRALLERPGAVLRKAALEERLYGWGEGVESNAVEVHVHRQRQKLGVGFVATVRGTGNRLTPGAAEARACCRCGGACSSLRSTPPASSGPRRWSTRERTVAHVERVLASRLAEAARMVASLVDAGHIGLASAPSLAATTPRGAGPAYEHRLSFHV